MHAFQRVWWWVQIPVPLPVPVVPLPAYPPGNSYSCPTLTITIGGSFQHVIKDHSHECLFQFTQVEVANIAYLRSTVHLPKSHFFILKYVLLLSPSTKHHLTFPPDNSSPKTHKRWNWDDLNDTSHQVLQLVTDVTSLPLRRHMHAYLFSSSNSIITPWLIRLISLSLTQWQLILTLVYNDSSLTMTPTFSINCYDFK